jgi:purine-nucleoside phosphorylase
LKNQVQEAATFIAARCEINADIGIILGTGLGPLADEMKNAVIIPYHEIPHFPESTVKFHAGRLVVGTLNGKSVMAMQGRFHYYEGYAMQKITLPVRVMHRMGIRRLIVTNAAGGIRDRLPAGTIAVITDHINMMGANPLIGPYDESLGERFPDMSEPYSKRLRQLTHRIADQLGISVADTVYAAVTGPSYETAAELGMLQLIGADTVGMSVVPEVLVARQLDMEVLAISVITDQALPDKMQQITHEDVSTVADQAGPKFRQLIKAILGEI